MNKMALSRSVYVGVKKETAEMKKKKKKKSSELRRTRVCKVGEHIATISKVFKKFRAKTEETQYIFFRDEFADLKHELAPSSTINSDIN